MMDSNSGSGSDPSEAEDSPAKKLRREGESLEAIVAAEPWSSGTLSPKILEAPAALNEAIDALFGNAVQEPTMGALDKEMQLAASKPLSTSLPQSFASPPVLPMATDTGLGFAAWDENLRSRRNLPTQCIRMPWEKWPYNQVLSNRGPVGPKMLFESPGATLPQLPSREEYLSQASGVASGQEMKGAIFKKSVQRSRHLSFKAMQDAVMQNMLRKLLLLLEMNFEASIAGKQLLQEFNRSGYDEKKAESLLLDIVGGRAPKTVTKRVNSLLKFALFVKQSRLTAPFPVIEAEVYTYLCQLRVEGASTGPSSFMSAITFAQHILGMQGCKEALESARNRGLSHNVLAAKTKVTPRSPLSVTQARILEEMCFKGSNIVDKVLAGYCLFLMLARARFSDAMFALRIVLDVDPEYALEGFIELQGSNVKTGTSALKKSMVLPMVAPNRALGEQDWASTWLANRELAGLKSSDFEFVQPGPDLAGNWLPRPWLIQEATQWLRDVFALFRAPISREQFFGTHSLKMTLLNWAAKFGVPVRVRRTMGYHQASDDNTVFLYGRENMAEPLRWIVLILQCIRDGDFSPDKSRSGRFVPGKNPVWDSIRPSRSIRSKKPQEPAEVPNQDEDSELEQHSNHSASSVSSAGGSSEDEDSVKVAEAAAEMLGHSKNDFTKAIATGRLYQHCETGTLHWLSTENASNFLCKRPISERFSRIKKPLSFEWPECKQCLKRLEDQSA